MGILFTWVSTLFYENTVGDDFEGDVIDLDDRGVRLEVLLKVCEIVKAGQLNVPEDDKKRSPGESIVDGLVKPETKTRKCSYCSHLYQNRSTRHLVGRINTFVSHPWRTNFQITVDALVEYEKALPEGSPAQFYFVDYFAVNQHSPGKDLKRLADLVGLSDTLTLMAEPWQNPDALTRLWCIFEIAHAVLKNTKIEIILAPNEIKSFQDRIRKNSSSAWELLGELLKNIDSANATATQKPDIAMIQKFIKTELGGFMKVDTMVADGLRNWYVRSAKALLKNLPDIDKGSNEQAELMWQVAEFLYSQSQYSEAAGLYDNAAVIYKSNNNEEWLTCEKDRVFMFRKMGKLKEALKMATQNLENQLKVRGPKHLGTLAAKRCLGAIQKDLGMNREAEQNLRATLEVLEMTEKPDSSHIQVTKYQLAEALRNLGRLEEAMEMYQELIDVKTNSSKYGPKHASTVNCVLMKARCISLSGHPERALSHYNDALPILRKDWGSNDPSVIKGAQWSEEARYQCAEAYGADGWSMMVSELDQEA